VSDASLGDTAAKGPKRSWGRRAALYAAEFVCFGLFLLAAIPTPRSTPSEHVPPTGQATLAGVALFAFLLLYSRARPFATRCWLTLLYVIIFGGAMSLTWAAVGW
jgi:hypothetical protein